MLFLESFSVFSGILCIGTTMEMRGHFGAKAKEKEAKDDFGFRIQRECRSTHSWCRSTPVSAQQSPWRFQIHRRGNLPQKTSLFALL